SNCFKRPGDDFHPWQRTNPMPVPTERERYVLDQGLQVYRRLYQRNDQQAPELSNLEALWQQVDNPSEEEHSDF
ncbi:MAG: tRNA (guanosine(46)-N7)-methyltransferase TrmB, partial [Cyanobacteriota bacterium]|nr:tRNA (guanosine(46)-N7)-methyltransferase TrmB [Cyanobacteriota bacterium]